MHKFLPVLALAFASAAGAADFDYAAYKPALLRDINAATKIDPRGNYWLDTSQAKFKTNVMFSGDIRPIDANVKLLITMWAREMKYPKAVTAAFNYEVQVSQVGYMYWMPIQDSLVQPWLDQIVQAERADVYLLRVGAYEQTPSFTIAGFSPAEW